jgi:hypothetical protein
VAYHPSRGVLPTVLRRCVGSRNVNNVQAMVRVGPQRHTEENTRHNIKFISTGILQLQFIAVVKLHAYRTASIMARRTCLVISSCKYPMPIPVVVQFNA